MMVTFHKRQMAQQPFTANEIAWVEFLRLVSNDTDPGSAVFRVQGLRRLLAAEKGQPAVV